MMKEIIRPIARELILSELNESTFLRKTNKGENDIYVIDSENAPHTLQEIGRLREVSFREGGGGTGEEIDLDEHDFGLYGYKQLIVWDPDKEEIIGGYRYTYGPDSIQSNGEPYLSTTDIFDIDEDFTKAILPQCIELGRSFVQPDYQPSKNRKGLFSLDNLWDGLAALTIELEETNYLFGKVTMYTNYNKEARDLILIFMQEFFAPQRRWVRAKPELKLDLHEERSDFREEIKSKSYKDAYLILNRKIRELGENIPPLINSYMNISPTMQVFDTSLNPFFGGVEETALLVNIHDIYPTKKDRHLHTYQKIDKDTTYLKAYWRRANNS